MKTKLIIICFFVLQNLIIAQVDSLINEPLLSNSFDQTLLENLPYYEMSDIISLFPSVQLRDGKIYLRSGESDEVGYELNGFSIRDPFTGNIICRIPKQALAKLSISTSPNSFNSKNSGLVSSSLKQGTDEFRITFNSRTDNITFKSSSNFFNGNKFLGTYSYGYNESNISISGPFLDKNLHYFANINYLFQRDRSPEFYPGVDFGKHEIYHYSLHDLVLGELNLHLESGPIHGNSKENISFISNIDFDLTNSKSSLLLLYSNNRDEKSKNPWSSISNTRVGITETSYALVGLESKYDFSAMLDAKIKLSYSNHSSKTFDPYLGDNIWSYGDNYANKEAGVGWVGYSYYGIDTSRFSFPNSLSYDDFSFEAQNYIDVTYSKFKREKFEISTEISIDPSPDTRITLGLNLTKYILRNFQLNTPTIYFAHRISNFEENYYPKGLESYKENVLNWDPASDIYGYDAKGNSSNEGIYIPFEPLFGKIDLAFSNCWESGNSYFGIRYNYHDLDNYKLNSLNKFFYGLMIDDNNFSDHFISRETRDFISYDARLVQYINNDLKLQFIFSKSIQPLQFDQIFISPNRFVAERNRNFIYNKLVNPDVDPKTSNNYEMNSEYTGRKFNIKVTGFIRHTINDIYPLIPVDDSTFYIPRTNGSVFPLTRNGIKTIVNGLSINGKYEVLDHHFLSTSLNYNNTTGNVGYRKVYDYYLMGVYDWTDLSYVSRFSGNFIYRFNGEQNCTFDLLKNCNLTLIAKFNSGFPYTTEEPTGLEDENGNETNMVNLNKFTTPWLFLIDMNIKKSFQLNDDITAEFSFAILNLFNNKIAEQFYPLTGTVTEDGQNYYNSDIYNALVIGYNRFYNQPRQIRLGIRLSYD